MIYTTGKYLFTQPPLESGDTVAHPVGEERAFIARQLAPGTVICEGVENVVIFCGDFVNCVPPNDTWRGPNGSLKLGGNWAQQDVCTNKEPVFIKHGLEACPPDCKHRTKDPVWREVKEEEFRRKKSEARDVLKPITDDDLAVVKDVDDDGITVQVFRVREHQYSHTLGEPRNRV